MLIEIWISWKSTFNFRTKWLGWKPVTVHILSLEQVQHPNNPNQLPTGQIKMAHKWPLEYRFSWCEQRWRLHISSVNSADCLTWRRPRLGLLMRDERQPLSVRVSSTFANFRIMSSISVWLRQNRAKMQCTYFTGDVQIPRFAIWNVCAADMKFSWVPEVKVFGEFQAGVNVLLHLAIHQRHHVRKGKRPRISTLQKKNGTSSRDFQWC